MHSFTSLNTCVKTIAAAAILFCSGAALAEQHASAPSNKVGVASSTENLSFGDHHQKKALNPSERAPSVAKHLNARRSYDAANSNPTLARPSALAQQARNKQALATAAACDASAFTGVTGSALVNAVKASTTECVNDLFKLTGTQAGSVFSESKMVTIANALKTTAASYNGTNSSNALQLILFLRAGYFVNYYHSADTGTYGAAMKTAITGALDAFAANANFGVVSDAHGEVLAEFVTLVDSATENARYLNSVVKRLLNSYNSSYNASYWMGTAVNNAFNVLFRGHQNDDFKALVQSDTSIVDTLYSFVNNNFAQLGTDNGYLVANAGREAGRFLQYTNGTALKTLARSRVKAMVDRSNVTGNTASLWVGLGEMIDYFDKANCSYYSMCDFKQKLETNVLPISHSCSPTLRLRAQALTAAQLQEACTIVGGEEGYFHTQVASGKVPVAKDNNAQLEMVVFKSSNDYRTYAGTLYGIDTNNGGMYLEGDPSAAGNQPRFIAYQAEWMLPKFEIWNLTHEYIHYLDGRFNMYGDFGAAISTNTVWWIEGFAEYMSYSYRKLNYTGAMDQAKAGTYSLSTIFNNDYNSGQTRVYNWGYLAVRYMFEKQRNKVTNLLGYFRPGNYTGYTNYMKSSSMGASMDADFKAWLPCVATPNTPACGGVNSLPTASFTQSVSGFSANFSDTSTDADGNIASRVWEFGDGTTSTSANPSKTYTSPGTYAVKLTVTDNSGGKASTTQNVTVSFGGNLPECPASANALGRNCVRSNINVPLNDYAYMYFNVPAGVAFVQLTTAGGTGNADMYANTLGQWATRNAYNYRSSNNGNSETITIYNPPAGYHYVSLYGTTAASGVSIKIEY